MNILPRSLREKSDISFMGILIAFVAIFTLGNAYGTEDSFFHFSNKDLSTWGKYLCYAIVAISLNMLWGYTGLLCLGQCLFFAIGAYMFGMYLMLMVGEDPVYNTALPDFMDMTGITELPAFWEPFHNPIFALIAALAVPGIVGFIFGLLAFRSRIKGVYFSILTQALTYAAFLLFNRNEFGLGATNGFTNFKEIFGADINDASTTRILFIATAVLLALVYWLISWLLQTKFGKVQQAIRDSENRVRFSGYSTTHFKVFIFVLSAMIAGAAGALYVPQTGIITPSEMLPTKGLDVVVWVAVGGRGTKLGPIIGAIAVSFLKSFTTSVYPEGWLFILGAVFIIVVLFMPDGIVGLWNKIINRKKKNPDSDPTLEIADEATE